MLPFVRLIINLIILFRGDLKKKPLHWKLILIVVFITGLCLSVVHGRSEYLEARMGVCFLDTWVPGWGAWLRSGGVG